VKGGSPSSKQLSLDFVADEPREADPDLLVQAEAEAAAIDYQIQMQAYALAARALIPEVADLKVTLHFLHPDIEVSLPDDLLEREACETAIDDTMLKIVSSSSPEAFHPEPAEHCRACSFVELCATGTNWLWRT
jgi:CRISPR/Cas system-associated exonuclease Cas4 (RecB family)